MFSGQFFLILKKYVNIKIWSWDYLESLKNRLSIEINLRNGGFKGIIYELKCRWHGKEICNQWANEKTVTCLIHIRATEVTGLQHLMFPTIGNLQFQMLNSSLTVISLTEAFNSFKENNESSTSLPEQESYLISQYTPFPSKKRKKFRLKHSLK